MTKSEISFIVVSHNSARYIAKCIDSIIDQSYKNFEIIVVDNNSTDDTVLIINEIIKKTDNVKLIPVLQNLGYGNAITVGFKSSKGEFLAILNADSYLDKEWSYNMINSFRSDMDIMSASGTIYFPDGQLQTTGGMMDKYGAVVQRGGKIFQSRNIMENNFFYNDGSCFMLRRNILEMICFDQNLFLYYEDVDMSWKIRMLGFKIAYVKEAVSYHDSGQSFSDVNPSKFYYIARNRLYVCMKNYSKSKALGRIPAIIFLIFLNSIVYDVSKNPKGYIKSFLRGIFWNLTHLRVMLKEQKKLGLLNKITDNELDSYLVPKSIELALIKNK